MLRRACLIVPLFLFGGCGDFRNPFADLKDPMAGFKNPFEEHRPYKATPVPADFSIVVDENSLTAANRVHTRKIITAVDSACRTTHTRYDGLGDKPIDETTALTPLAAGQLQELWNAVGSGRLLEGPPLWDRTLTAADIYSHNSVVVRIQAQGTARTYQAVNGAPAPVLPLITLLGTLPPASAQESGPGAPATRPASRP